MGYVLRVRLASFFAGVAVASAGGLYLLQKDYITAHKSISEQVNHLHESLDSRISAVEKRVELSNGGGISAVGKLEGNELKVEGAAPAS